MNVAKTELIIKKMGIQTYCNQATVAKYLGVSRQTAAAFIKKHAIKARHIGKEKSYNIYEVDEATER